jgi:hypothetical protein
MKRNEESWREMRNEENGREMRNGREMINEIGGNHK